jgi:acyl carrier protein
MTRDEALVWVATVFEEPPENVRSETVKDEIRGWDSLGVLTLMADLDEKFQIQLSEEDIDGLAAVADILSLLKQRGVLSE